MRLALRRPAFVAVLTLLWIGLWDQVTVANLVGGVLVGLVVARIAPREPVARSGAHFHPFHALRYIGRLTANLIESNLRLAWEILTPGDGTSTGIVAVPMRGGSDEVAILVANSITLTPGTLTVEVKRDGEVVTLYVHGLYTRDVEAVRHEVMELEARALRAFGTPAEAERGQRDLDAHAAAIRARRPEDTR